MKNAYIGYTYQKLVTSLLLAKMDVERNIDSIEIEADVNNDFDDLKISSSNVEFYFQIKDFNDVSLNSLKFTDNSIFIKDKEHSLSKFTNVIFFRQIDIIPNCEIFGIPALNVNDVYIISLNRENIDERISSLYNLNQQRESTINKFFSRCLDNRKFRIERKDLPTIPVFDTNLIEPTIDVGRKHLTVENILVIEGKPGVGKSHLVNCLTKEYPNSIIYRFWISSQDKEYNQRLKFSNFIFDFSKKLFNDQVIRAENEVLEKLWEVNKTVIIDGLDHVENYDNKELKRIIDFIQKLQSKCKTIVLTRPLKYQLEWSKHELVNWNKKQTEKVLDELFHITDYDVCSKIYSITDGYPILVKYLAEHFKEHNNLPDLNTLKSIDEYYDEIFKDKVNTKSLLTLFLCCRSFYMQHELQLFLEEEMAVTVSDFIRDYPYLFEKRLNRISLLHDSFNTYLRNQNIDYSKKQKTVKEIVYKSILNSEDAFLTRFDFFYLDKKMKREIILKYSTISEFKDLVNGAIDFEAIQSFYGQLRESLLELSPNDLEVENYYELSLIINIAYRDHISTNNQFLYTYIKSLLFNGYTEKSITSSGYLFGMLYYIKTGSADLLLNQTSNDLYDTNHFFESLVNETKKEDNFFRKHLSPLSKKEIKKLISTSREYDFKEKITLVLENLFIHKKHQSDYLDLTSCIEKYVYSEEQESVCILENFLERNNIRPFFARWILKDAKQNILALGHVSEINDYVNLTLNDFIVKNRQLGSFDLWVEILNHIRLSLHLNKTIDISSISKFWTKYYQRKDYSLISLPSALFVFEQKGFVNKTDAVELITKIQEVSEKGYRGLLADYIEQHSPNIIDFLINTFDIEELHISWFTLSSKYIDQFPDIIFNISMKGLLKYHSHNREIDFNEVENVISSSRCDEFRSILEITKFRVRIPKRSNKIRILKKNRIAYTEYIDDSNSYKQDSQSRLNNGILTIEDKKIIIERKLKPEVVAGYSDGFYSSLSDLKLFQVFPKNEIKKSIKPILYNAIVGKVNTINSFHNLYYFPGNALKLINDYKIEANYDSLYESFTNFLELSMFEINPNKPHEQEV